jgi:hypothetical protein
MCLPQLQNIYVNNICIAGNHACMNSEQGGVKYQFELIMCCVDHLFPYHVTGAYVRTDPPHLLSGWLPIKSEF